MPRSPEPSREQHSLSRTSKPAANPSGQGFSLQGCVPPLLSSRGNSSSAVPRGTREKHPELRLLLHHTPGQSPAAQDSLSPLRKKCPADFPSSGALGVELNENKPGIKARGRTESRASSVTSKELWHPRVGLGRLVVPAHTPRAVQVLWVPSGEGFGVQQRFCSKST